MAATVAVTILLPTAFAEIATFVVDGNSYSCLPMYSANRVAFPADLAGDEKEIQIVRNMGTNCAGDNVHKDADGTLSEIDVSKVSGKVAIFEICSDASSREEYWLDYFRKGLALRQAGAIMLIAVEAYTAKLPEHMDLEITRTLEIPVCVMERRTFSSLKSKVEEIGAQAAGDFSSLPFYSPFNEPRFDSPITAVKLSEVFNGNRVQNEFPATSVTYNPSQAEAIQGSLVELKLKDNCKANQATDWASCVACWSSDEFGNSAGPIENLEEIINTPVSEENGGGKILFMPYHGHTAPKTCYPDAYQYSAIAWDLMATGLLLGQPSDEYLPIYGPYLVGSQTVPTLTILSIHTETTLQVLEDGNSVQASFPALVNQQGPAFYAPKEVEIGFTSIGFWDDQLDGSSGDRHFECFSGQALYNPNSFLGVPAPQTNRDSGNIEPGSGRKLVVGHPSEACASRDTCADCLRPGNPQLDIDTSTDYSVSVLLLNEDDFPCYHQHSQFSLAAIEANPLAVLVAQVSASRHSISDTMVETLDFPTFTISEECGLRVVGNPCQPESACEDRHVYVQLPVITNGVAETFTTTSYDLPLEPAFVQFKSPPGLSKLGMVEVGQVNFNPDSSSSVAGDVVVAQTQPECNDEKSCLECDRMPWHFRRPRNEYRGKVVLFSLLKIDPSRVYVDKANGAGGLNFTFTGFDFQGVCLHPWSNIVEELQGAGAVAVLFMDGDNIPRTLVQEGVPHEITIPSFNLPIGVGQQVLAMEFLTELDLKDDLPIKDSNVTIILPRLSQGKATLNPSDVVITDGGSDPEGVPAPAVDYAGSGFLIPKWAIAVVSVGAFLFIMGSLCIWHMIRRRRRMFAFNRLDTAVQADMLADIMTMGDGPDEGSHGDRGEAFFTDEPLHDDAMANKGGGLQMVNMPCPGKHEIGVGP